jgi:hypothetical protein
MLVPYKFYWLASALFARGLDELEYVARAQAVVALHVVARQDGLGVVGDVQDVFQLLLHLGHGFSFQFHFLRVCPTYDLDHDSSSLSLGCEARTLPQFNNSSYTNAAKMSSLGS